MKRVFIFLLIILAILFLFRFKTISVQEIPIEIKVENRVGFNLDPNKLSFGTIMPGGSGTRSILLKNNENDDIYVKFQVYGELKDWVILPKEEIIKIGEEKELGFAIKIPKNIEFGNYNGVLKVIILKKII